MSSLIVVFETYMTKFTFFEHVVKDDKKFRVFSIMPMKTEDLDREEMNSRVILTYKEFSEVCERVLDTVKNRYDEQYLTIWYSPERNITIARKDENWILTVKDKPKEMTTSGYVSDWENMQRFVEDFKRMIV